MESYKPRIDAETRIIVRGGREIEIRSARANALYDEADRAVDSQCGPVASQNPKLKAMRAAAVVTYRADIEAERARLFERATARFRSQ